MNERLFSFVGAHAGSWQVRQMDTIVGAPLPAVNSIDVQCNMDMMSIPAAATWVLRGITSNERYVTQDEKQLLLTRQEGLGRPYATCAALIPIRKNASWWALTQDQRRKIFEEQSRHIQIGLNYLPAIARRLHHCRDLGHNEPFDFLTWFEYAPTDSQAFDAMLAELRASHEWSYVEREVDIRLVKTV